VKERGGGRIDIRNGKGRKVIGGEGYKCSN